MVYSKTNAVCEPSMASYAHRIKGRCTIPEADVPLVTCIGTVTPSDYGKTRHSRQKKKKKKKKKKSIQTAVSSKSSALKSSCNIFRPVVLQRPSPSNTHATRRVTGTVAPSDNQTTCTMRDVTVSFNTGLHRPMTCICVSDLTRQAARHIAHLMQAGGSDHVGEHIETDNINGKGLNFVIDEPPSPKQDVYSHITLMFPLLMATVTRSKGGVTGQTDRTTLKLEALETVTAWLYKS